MKCPIDGCGRMFQNELTMLQHVKRRHPLQSQKIKQKTTNQMIEIQHKITEEMNKLPKMSKIIEMSKQKKSLQFHRRSTSKKRKQLVNIIQNNQSKVSLLINQSRQLVEQDSSRKLLKRPSLLKKSSQQNDSTNKLPSLTQSKVKKLKLQSLRPQTDKNISFDAFKQKPKTKISFIQQNQSQMYSTAPNFTKQAIGLRKVQSMRSRSKGKQQQKSEKQLKRSEKQLKKSDKQLSTIQTKQQHKQQLTNKKTQTQTLSEKALQPISRPSSRPLKKLLQRKNSIRKPSDKSTLSTQCLSQSLYIQKQSTIVTTIKPLTFNKKPYIGQKGKKKEVLSHGVEWGERTVTIRNQKISHFLVPQNAKVQYLFLHSCQIHTLDLNQCFSIIQLSLNNNLIRQLDFLSQTQNGAYQNIECIFLDHNELTSLSTLPVYLKLKKLSLSFNKIQNIQECLKILSQITCLQQLDLSFNPIRKKSNYKQRILLACPLLKLLDGMKVTLMDRSLSQQYQILYSQQNNLIPLKSPSINKSIDQDQINIQNYQEIGLSQEELDKEIRHLEKGIKATKEQFQIIMMQNSTLQQQIAGYLKDKNQTTPENNHKLYNKLKREVEELQLLNFLQYASEKQLNDLLLKKVAEKGLSVDIIAKM